MKSKILITILLACTLHLSISNTANAVSSYFGRESRSLNGPPGLDMYTWSTANIFHPNRVMQWINAPLCDLVDCGENKWFLGQNLFDSQHEFLTNRAYTPNMGNIIQGTDLGGSLAMWQGYTLMYMGDTHGNVSATNCGVPNECNDAILLLEDDNGLANGLDARILVDDQNPAKFRPLIIPGINQSGSSLDPGYFGPFNTPSGGAVGSIITGDKENPLISNQLYFWFSLAVATDHPNSFLTCSDDGIEFHSCQAPNIISPDPWPARHFSSGNFVLVSPLAFPYEWWDQINVSAPCTLCTLKNKLSDYWFGKSPGMLLFGRAGGPQNQNSCDGGYRESPLYLGYMELQSLKIWYFTGSDWSEDETQAVPVLSDIGRSWENQRKYWFGEALVGLIPGTGLDDTYLVMLSNQEGSYLSSGRVYYWVSTLLNPDRWSPPQLTCAIGYAPCGIAGYTEIQSGNPNRLLVYHTISSWNGQRQPRFYEPYGVFTTQLRLRQDPNDVNSPCGEAPAWPPPFTFDYPDLIVTNIIVTSYSKSSISYCYEIMNVGSSPANLDGPTCAQTDNVSVQAFLSADKIFNNSGDLPAGGTILGHSPLGNLMPGETVSGCFGASAQIDTNITPYLTLMVDWGEVVAESNENNNSAWILIP